MILRQKAFLLLIIAVNAVLWAVPSNVVELISRQREVLLCRFSREHFALNMGVLFVSVIGLYIDRATGQDYKRRWFQVLATMLFLTPCVIALDWASRLTQPAHYIRDSTAYHRPPFTSFTRDFSDRPEPARSYPNAPAGYGTVSCVYQTDSRGFRNRDERSSYDIVVLGDSFAEGSNVSDEHAWPLQLANRLGASVCNLGMSGYSPIEYAASLDSYGISLKPRFVICAIYEGNDFRQDDSNPQRGRRGLSDQLKHYVKQSPLRQAIDRLLVQSFGGIGANAHVDGIEILSWMPVAVPAHGATKYYAFDPKDLLDASRPAEVFAADRRWRAAADALERVHDLCRSAGATLVVLFVPCKEHVVLPIVRESLPADKVRAFAAIQTRKLPEPAVFMEQVFSNLSAKEEVVGQWCSSNGVGMISLTDALRAAAAGGSQVYYTYDQHWTPIGHDLVAQIVSSRLAELDLTESRP